MWFNDRYMSWRPGPAAAHARVISAHGGRTEPCGRCEMGARPVAPASPRTPLLARLKVGTKLMLLVLLPVCVLLGFTTVTAVADWRAASQLQSFQTAARLSLAAGRLADERTAAVLLRMRQAGPDRARLAAAQRAADQALHEVVADAAAWDGAGD